MSTDFNPSKHVPRVTPELPDSTQAETEVPHATTDTAAVQVYRAEGNLGDKGALAALSCNTDASMTDGHQDGCANASSTLSTRPRTTKTRPGLFLPRGTSTASKLRPRSWTGGTPRCQTLTKVPAMTSPCSEPLTAQHCTFTTSRTTSEQAVPNIQRRCGRVCSPPNRRSFTPDHWTLK